MRGCYVLADTLCANGGYFSLGLIVPVVCCSNIATSFLLILGDTVLERLGVQGQIHAILQSQCNVYAKFRFEPSHDLQVCG